MKFNKRHIIQKLVELPDKGRRAFWPKQMAMLNKLLEKFPNEKFWQKVDFGEKYQGMEYLLSPYGLKLVSKKYLEFNYKIPRPKKVIFSDQKVGESVNLPKKPRTLKDFLNDD